MKLKNMGNDVHLLERGKEGVSIEASLYPYKQCNSKLIRDKIKRFRFKRILKTLYMWALMICSLVVLSIVIRKIGLDYTDWFFGLELIVISLFFITSIIRSVKEMSNKQILACRKVDIGQVFDSSFDTVVISSTMSKEGKEDLLHVPKTFLEDNSDIYIVLSRKCIYAVKVKKEEQCDY